MTTRPRNRKLIFGFTLVELLVAALEEIEPVYTFVAVNPANADGYDADGPEHVGSRWSGGDSEILVWYGSIYAAKLSKSGTCFVTRMLEPSGEWQWLRFDPNEVLTEEGDPMPCGGLEFVSNLEDIVADSGLVWTDDPQGKKPSATQTDDGYDPTQPGSGDPGMGRTTPGRGMTRGPRSTVTSRPGGRL